MLFLFHATPSFCFSQNYLPIADQKRYLQERKRLDSLLQYLPAKPVDIGKVVHLIHIGYSYCFFSFDSALYYAEKALQLAEKINDPDQVSKSYALFVSIYDNAKDHRNEEDYLEKGYSMP